MTRILTICPSIYPERLSHMYDSYASTTSDNNKIIIINEKGSITKILNKTFENYPDYEFYHITNDDVKYKTKDWDIKLANKGKISHGSDSITNGFNCQFPMIDGNIVRALGWLQMPTLERYCGDVVWRFIGQQLNILNHVKDVNIEHHWNGCSDLESNTKDMERFADWLPNSYKDIEKIRRVLNG